MSVNSDEVAQGIIKAVYQIAMTAGAAYCVYLYPWLLLLLIPVGLVWLAWAAWKTLKESPDSTSHKVGRLLQWVGMASFVVGFITASFGFGWGPDGWARWAVVGGLAVGLVGVVVKHFDKHRLAKAEAYRRGDSLKRFCDEVEQRKRDSLKRARDEMARTPRAG